MDDNFEFDKFMQDIVKREEEQREVISEHQAGQEELPQRTYNRLYRERWQNRIKWDDKR
jgi:hypothetical protein